MVITNVFPISENMKKNDHSEIISTLEDHPGNLDILIIELLDDNDFSKKHNARKSLVKMGKTATPHLHKLLTSENGKVRMEVAKIVQLIADKRSVPVLIGLLDDAVFDVRWIAAEGLIRIGRQCIVPLIKAIRDGKSTFLLDKRAHQVLNKLLYENEKEQLLSLMLCLDDYHSLGETAPVEAARALKTIKKFSN
jgi:HEAT repeat protein